MKRPAIALLIALGLTAACTNESGTREALDAEGFSGVVVVGYSLWGCGKDDSTCTEFIATSAHGKRVHGVVGCGLSWEPWAKGCTVRITGGAP